MVNTLLEAVNQILAKPIPMTMTFGEEDNETGEKKKYPIEVSVYPLTYEEFLEAALLMPPELKWSEEEFQKYQETGEIPPEKPHSNAEQVEFFKHIMYVLKATLRKSVPTEDYGPLIEAIEKDAKIFHMFLPLAQAAWMATLPFEELVKKKPSA